MTKDLELEINARAPDGMTLEPAKRRIKVAADQEPTVRFTQPEESLAVIPTAEVPVQVEARDDFGVGLLGISFKIGDGPEETLHLARLKDQPLPASSPRDVVPREAPTRLQGGDHLLRVRRGQLCPEAAPSRI